MTDQAVPSSAPSTLGDSGASPALDPGSFRDPGGFVYTRDGRLLRQVNRAFATRWQDLTSSGILGELQAGNLLVRHEDVDLREAFAPDDAHAVIEPERIPLVSYPYEWSFGQLKDAALVTLEAQVQAAAKGFTLRDASAYNVQFQGGKPVLIDTLSFERAIPDSPWEGYRQFCEHFLTPLALMAHRDVRCGLMLRDFIDGIPLDLAAALLPGRTKLNVGLASHIHAHAGAQRRRTSSSTLAPAPPRPSMSALKQAALIDNLRRTIEGLSWEPAGTAWADYADNTSYEEAAARSKDDLVRGFVTAAGGTVVWDLGANTGRFSAIAASVGRQVVAWDGDPAATERHYRATRKSGDGRVLPLVVDLVNPSPGLGWAHAERRPFLERANADVVLALALVHHLAIGRNIQFPMIRDFFAALAPTLIVEYIPQADPMVQTLLSARRDVFPYPTLDQFKGTFGERFRIEDDEGISGSDRRVLRMTRR
jgi:hypothetical protein